MIKILLPLLFLGAFATLSSPAHASEMIVSKDSNFFNQTTQFAAGETIYIKVEANSSGSTRHELHLKDSEYNTIAIYNLNNSGGNTFTTSLSAPSTEGYYSLEAVVESPGSNSTSVKTIKVGNSTNGSVKVNVNVKSEGQNTNSNNDIEEDKEKVVQEKDEAKNGQFPSAASTNTNPVLGEQDEIATSDYVLGDPAPKQNVLSIINGFLKLAVTFLWPF